MPRFAVEEHMAALTGGAGPDARRWPESTRRISELRLTIEFERRAGWRKGAVGAHARHRRLSRRMAARPAAARQGLSAQWSRETIEAASRTARARCAAPWRGFLAEPRSGRAARTRRWRATAADLFTAYLRACRDDRYALSTLPPGRFLMPGDLEGSPALTFAPLRSPRARALTRGSLAADDGAALRGLSNRMSCGRSSAIISRGSTGRSCWSTRSSALNSGPLRRAPISNAR